MVVLNVIDEFLEEIARIVRLEEIVVEWLRLIILCIELVAHEKWITWSVVVSGLHFLVKFKNLHNVGFLTLSRRFAFVAVLVISLPEVSLIVVSVEITMVVTANFVEAAWNSVFINAAYNGRAILQMLVSVNWVLPAGHQDFDSF